MRALLSLLCIAALVIQGAHAKRRWSKPLDDVYARYLGRFTALREALAGEARVGYLGDAPRVVNFPDDVSTGFLFAQHALVPTILDPVESGRATLVVNWHRAENAAPIPAGYHLVTDFGSGVTLWRRS